MEKESDIIGSHIIIILVFWAIVLFIGFILAFCPVPHVWFVVWVVANIPIFSVFIQKCKELERLMEEGL